MKRVLLETILALPLFFLAAGDDVKPPHIIMIYADDLGWNDVSFHGSPQIPTPNIDALAMNGVLFNNYYGEWLCTPSRGAFLTGKYPMRLGLQHYVILGAEKTALPVEEKTLPQHLKQLGYSTHMIGKWHLGYYNYDVMPTRRGFDSFFGYVNGVISYYDYINSGYTFLPDQPEYIGIDLYNDTTPIRDFRGVYATHAFTERAENIILNHDSSEPLFMYLAHLAMHSSVKPQRLQAPGEEISKFKYIKDMDRRIYAAMMTILDEGVGKVFEALHSKGMLENCVFMFVADNGGEVNPEYGGHGSNYPLRGNKMTPWEGAIRLPAVLWSPLLNLSKPRLAEQLMHVSDWLPTLYTAAGGDVKDLGEIDGHDMWETLVNDSPSPRTDMLQTLDPVWGVSAYRWGDLKVVNGTSQDEFGKWYGPSGKEDVGDPPSMSEWVFKKGSAVGDVLKQTGWWIADDPEEMYRRALVTCQQPPPEDAYKCNANKRPCLFNVTADPCEYYDLADDYPEILEKMMNKIYLFSKEAMPPQSKASDPRGDPMCHNFTFVPWLEPEYYSECSYASGAIPTTDASP